MSQIIFISELFKYLSKCSWWVKNASQDFSGAINLLKKLDLIAKHAEQNPGNSLELMKKAKDIYSKKKITEEQALDSKETEMERKTFALFSELMVFNEFKEKNFESIIFIKTKNKISTPDLSANINNFIYYIEVKRIQIPKNEDENLRINKTYQGQVGENFNLPLLKKIQDKIDDANKKFAAVPESKKLQRSQKILVLDFEPGIDARLSGPKNNFNPTLDDIFDPAFFNNLENDNKITILRRKYF